MVKNFEIQDNQIQVYNIHFLLLFVEICIIVYLQKSFIKLKR